MSERPEPEPPERETLSQPAARRKSPWRDVALPASGFLALLGVVWFVNYQLRARLAPSAEETEAAPPLPRPAQVVAEAIAVNPDAAFRALRPMVGVAGSLLPHRVDSLVASGFGLPPYLGALVDAEEPVVGAVGRDARGAYWVLGAHITSPRELLAELTGGASPRFWIEERPEQGVTLILPKPGLTPMGSSVGLCGKILLAAEHDEHLLALGPYVARTLARRKGPTSLVRVEVEAGALDAMAVDRWELSTTRAMRLREFVAGLGKLTLDVNVTSGELAAVLHVAPRASAALPRLEAGSAEGLLDLPLGPVAAFLRAPAHWAAVWGEPLLTGDASARLEAAGTRLAEATAGGVACVLRDGPAAGVLCRARISNEEEVRGALDDATAILTAKGTVSALETQWGLAVARLPAGEGQGLRARAPETDAHAFDVLWKTGEGRFDVGLGLGAARALEPQSSATWRTRKAAARWLSERPLAFALLAQPAKLGTPNAASNPEALLGLTLEPAPGGWRVGLLAEPEALSPLVAALVTK